MISYDNRTPRNYCVRDDILVCDFWKRGFRSANIDTLDIIQFTYMHSDMENWRIIHFVNSIDLIGKLLIAILVNYLFTLVSINSA